MRKEVGELVDYYHADHLGSIRLITDESGTIVSEMCYDPFGEPLLEGEQDFFYTGKERDMSTGLYYFGARYYDPEIGRFITRDTVEGDYTNPQCLNRYSYCRNNPLLYLDSDGRMEKKFAIAGTKSSHPYSVYGVPPEQNTYGLLLLSVPITGDKVVRVEGCFIKHYDSQNATSSESVPMWAPSSTNVSVVALQIECNETMMEAEVSLTAVGEFVFVGLQETESGEIIKITAKIYPKSEGEVIIEFSFEVWAPGQEVEIKITLFPSTIALLPFSDDELREEWEVTVPAGDGPTAA